MIRTSVVVALAVLSGCGGSSMPSRQDVEREVSRQALTKVSQDDSLKATSACAEQSPRRYTCRVRLSLPVAKSLGGGSVRIQPKTVHAIVSKDGDRIVVADLDSL